MYRSAESEMYKAVRELLVRAGVQVGGGASYPRVEVHSFNEGEPLDKGMRLREVSIVVESMSTTSKGESLEMNGENLSRLVGGNLDTEHFHIVGIIPSSLNDMEETLDTQAILYRQLQTLRIIISQKD